MPNIDTLRLEIPPSVYRDISTAAAGLKYVESNLIRFRYGLAESFGGWTKYFSTAFTGVPRNALTWVQLDGTLNTAVGTHKKVELLQASTKYDITPYRALVTGTLGASPFATTNGSPTVTVTHVAHGRSVGDIVWFGSVTSFNGVDMGAWAWEVVTTPTADTYTITYIGNATGTSSGGGTPTYSYDGKTLGANPFTTANGSTTVVLTFSSHGCSTGDNVTINGASTFNGVDPNGSYEVTVSDANTLTYTATTTASAGGAGGGSAARIHCNLVIGNPTGTSMRIVHLQKWGEDLVMNPSPDGNIYLWDATLTASKRARILPKAPTADFILVGKDDFHLNAYGTNSDNMAQAWCSIADLSQWTATSTNTAGSKQYISGSKVVSAVASAREIVVFTDTTLYAQQLVGGDDVYNFTPIGSATIMGPLSAAEHNGIVRWMGNGQFYKYDGAISPIPCTMQRAVFKDVNTTEARGICCGVNQEFNEFMWFYTATSTSATYNDSYAKVNFGEGDPWDSGTLARTCWQDRGILFNPLACSPTGYLYKHEDGITADSDPMESYVITGDTRRTNGNGKATQQYWAELEFDAVMEGNCDLIIRHRRHNQDTYKFKGPWRITSDTTKIRPRVKNTLIVLEWQTPQNSTVEILTEDGQIITQETAGAILDETVLRDRTEDLLTYWRQGVSHVNRQDAGDR